VKFPVLSAALALAALAQGAQAFPQRFQGYSFDAYAQRSDGPRYRESSVDGQAKLYVRPGEEYSIVVNNPLPVRAAVAVSIDGLNSIDGSRTTPGRARKWMIAPHSSLSITGWQTGSDTARNFVFTPDDASFAQWKENKSGRHYTKNLGVIGVAWFWNREELEAALHPPQPFADGDRSMKALRRSADSSNMAGMPAQAPAAAAAEAKAGTGMGEEAYHPVTEVEFNANAGMYSLKDVLKLYYEFAKEPARPQPFVGQEEEGMRFTEDMYKQN
jgi:hypothetical protein